MTHYFLLYKHYNIAWAKKNSCILPPNGSIYSHNQPESNEDILGYFKGGIPKDISLETFRQCN